MPEVNFDSIVGPTHNYAGLSPGNVASSRHRGETSRPRDAVLQGLGKMAELHALGVPQAVLPPQERPSVELLRALGFTGPDRAVIETAAREDPLLLARATSASAMWAANAATVSASDDCADRRVHMSVANLRTMLHRAIEAPQTERTLRAVFPDESCFVVHAALPGAESLGDEGAANHTRLHPGGADPDGSPGVELFVHGQAEGDPRRPLVHPARQTLAASQAIARRHRLHPDRVVFALQDPRAIDAGVFHNDVIAVGHGPFLLHHERAFADRDEVLAALRARVGPSFCAVEVDAARVSLDAAVRSYLFNSQLVWSPSLGRVLIAPTEARDEPSTRAEIDRLVADPEVPIAAVRFMNLRESMRNGGGPACLRLRVPLTDLEWAAVAPGVRFSTALHERLAAWARRHYRETLAPAEIADPSLLDESRAALDELTTILGLGAIYPFQR